MIRHAKPHSRRLLLAWIAGASTAGCVLPGTGNIERAPTTVERPMVAIQLRIPESMRIEHAEIHSELERITLMPGDIGAAARELAHVLHPHFMREEQIALPPLGLLAPLARGAHPPDMRGVLPMTDSLRVELPRMLDEHKAIRAATLRLRDAARAAHDSSVERFAEKLALHARSEEEMFYPAAVLVGELVRARMRP